MSSKLLDARTDVGAIVVTYYPDGDIGERIATIADQVSFTVVVDNGSPPRYRKPLSSLNRADVVLLENGENEGIAAALNRGVARLRLEKLRWAVTFDQDSVPAANMIQQLCDTISYRHDREKVALVGPNIIDINVPAVAQKWLTKHESIPLLFRRIACSAGSELEVTAVITSGALMSLPVMEQIGAFRDDFFIDYVDTEYCLRALRYGFKIIVSCDAILFHRLGEKRNIQIGPCSFRPSHHSVDRRYYIARNSIPMAAMYGWRFPHWLFFDMCASTYNFAKIALFEKDRIAKLLAAGTGIVDGMRGRLGRRRVINLAKPQRE